MKRRIFTIQSEAVIDNLTAFLKSQPLDPLIEVIVQLKKKDRSAEQNRYYWQILTIIANDIGMSKNEAHNLYKRKYLIKIFERDHSGFAKMINSIRKVHTEGFKQDAKAMGDQIVRLTSTTSATVDQFSEYLKDIVRDATNNGIILPHPDDQDLVYGKQKQ